MKINVVYGGENYDFELVSTGGDNPPTNTTGAIGLPATFVSSLTVALHSEIPNMNDFYLLLVALTRNTWEGMIAYDEKYNTRPPELTSWRVRKPKEGEYGLFVCTIGYKANLSTKTVNYTIGETE